MNIFDPIIVHCRNKPTELALCAPGTEFNLVSYARLERYVNNICRNIIAAGIEPRNRIAVYVEDQILHALVILALTRLGAITISAQNEPLSWCFTIDAVIEDRPHKLPTARSILAGHDWTAGDGLPPKQLQLHNAAPDDNFCIFLTPQTGGKKNGVLVTNRMIATRIDRQKMFFGPQAPFCARTYLDLPLTHSLGFQVLLATLWRGGALVLRQAVAKTIEALATYKVQNIVGSSQSLLTLVKEFETRPSSRLGLKAVFCAGDTTIENLSERIGVHMCTNLTKGYMSKEATMVASMPTCFAAAIPDAAGFVMPGVTVEIVDDDCRVLPTGKEGKVRLRSEYGITEYLEDPEETQRAFRDGWFHSGDIGFLTPDNILVIRS